MQASNILTKAQTSQHSTGAFGKKNAASFYLISCWLVFVSVCACICNCMCTFLPWTAPLCRRAEGRKQRTLEEKDFGGFCVLRAHVDECGCQQKLLIVSAGH